MKGREKRERGRRGHPLNPRLIPDYVTPIAISILEKQI